MTTKDLIVNSYTSWGKRFKKEGKLFVDLLRGADKTKIATFGESTAKAFDTTATVGEQHWDLSFDIAGKATATLPDGRVFQASAPDKGFSKSKRVDIDMAGVEMTAINEEKSNWIIDDANSQKVAQFSGINNGMRASVLEFEEGLNVPAEQEIFLSWIARKTLESKMLGSSWGLTIFLIILTPIIIFMTFN
ncbi:hypothetical protein [Corynebacterium callunae]|uniref:hypothetical protein n=1 Tax=Corynebacterium callunae TaxID=1721 RepID=UPI0004A3D825|nr:hypothetical protein [Corynebacterium callunae]MCK2199331.1 hypothetical protein [Corynebacterium callunae]